LIARQRCPKLAGTAAQAGATDLAITGGSGGKVGGSKAGGSKAGGSKVGGSANQAASLLAVGIAHHQAGRLDQAMQTYAAVLQRDPNDAGALHYLGVIAHQRGNQTLAAELIGRALTIWPTSPDANHNLAIVEAHQGRADDAARHARRAVELDPAFAMAWNTLGASLKSSGAADRALDALCRALALDPALAQAHNNRGNTHQAGGRLDLAMADYDRAVQLDPGYAEAHNNRGNALLNLARVDEAVAALERAAALRPDLTNTGTNLAVALQAHGQGARARLMAWRAVALSPGYGAAHNNLGTVLGETGDVEGVIAAYRRAIDLEPGSAAARGNLANTLRQQGALAEARAEYRRALAFEPGNASTHSSLLLCMLYDSDCDNAALFAEYRRWEVRYAAPLYARIRPHGNARDPERRLRIGYMSGDFADHPLAYNIEDLFERHDRAQVAVHAYAQVPNPDEVTARFRKLADGWRSTVGLTDEAVDDLIRADGIDILVNLAGHTANSRLRALAYKPAPVQVSYGIGTSGMSVVDYWLTDAVFHPADTTEGHTEELWRLPVLVVHRPPPDAPPLASTPATRNGFVTFGSFNNPSKMTDRVIALWARILLAVPDSRLAFKFFAWFRSPLARDRLIQAFGRHGVAADRLIFLWEGHNRRDHLEQVAGIDIALDSFPFNGWTTTFEALWMGVPVVALAGERFLGRIGASFLTAAGLGRHVAASHDAYAEIAIGLARDDGERTALRRSLRIQVAGSPLCDAAVYVRSVEAAYRTMWRRWCHGDRR
jgi:predicted O-linked N-acetylglucosamine transferase (SPINDLY family)